MIVPTDLIITSPTGHLAVYMVVMDGSYKFSLEDIAQRL